MKHQVNVPGQLDLFKGAPRSPLADVTLSTSMQARARRTDPSTSQEAATKIEDLGRAGSQRRKCYDAILREPGLTASELDRVLGFNHEVAHKRLPELRDGGFLKTGAERICRVRGSMCLTWWPASAEGQQT